ncbi:polyprenyl synthetase family protein [Terricaulis sp.]|uniref:polyprenyl synthetase family protein n=1 Tax=Terricaulis sp. TaxID=2768686 RepID=UPI000AC699F7|nr:polyprenyl synthetase family protein [Terricaulis sp.]MDZ4691542.1 polyprenyl synthetase family protein [Terricaulis sp.]
MALAQRVEAALQAAIVRADGPDAPPLLAKALHYSVFPGGARVRPMLCLAVAQACGDDQPALSDAAAAAVELMHCASLVHDDLPCFDNAATRRGKPSVHALFGEPIALLAGDALIVMAFERLALAGAVAPLRLAPLIGTIARGVGAPSGIVAGQAWESEPNPPLELYHQAKTGALFVAATMSGALAAGADAGPWRALGETLGAAYQVADDLLDAVQASESDKPLGQDALLDRPSAVAKHGIKGALAQLNALVEQAVESVPPCEGAHDMRALVRLTAMRLAPKQLARSAA